MNTALLRAHVEKAWSASILPRLCEYVRIPNKSPHFDPEWERNGHMERAVQLMAAWCREQPIAGMQVEIRRLPGRTPLLFIDIPGSADSCVLLYGHLDKQPEFTGWEAGLGPWEPVIRDGKLYGRGGADDGYAVFSSLTAIAALDAQRIPRARCVVMIEACEESGSPDLPAHVESLAARIGTPSLVVCLDAECGNYDQLWCTTSLRGNLIGTLEVQVLTEGVHSGSGSGTVPSCVRVLRQLLERIEDGSTGTVRGDAFSVPISEQRRQQAITTARVLGDGVWNRFPFVAGAGPVSDDPVELILNTTWRSTLTITGIEGLPALRDAGNVLVPQVSAKLSFRLPPTGDPQRAAAETRRILECAPPCGARVKFTPGSAMGGWEAPTMAPWLEESVQSASRDFFGRDCMYMGTGGSIPFMGMLGERFPGTQFVVTGVLGPHANAHGPNEFLHLETARRITGCVAQVLADHARR